jgi:hypothetical protein
VLIRIRALDHIVPMRRIENDLTHFFVCQYFRHLIPPFML